MLSDERIEGLLEEEKGPVDALALRTALRSAPIRRHSRRASKRVRGRRHSWFVLHLRQNELDKYDFSVILTYLPHSGPEKINLRRHNGRNHRHVNKLERTSFTGVCHVHQATERYQAAGGHVPSVGVGVGRTE